MARELFDGGAEGDTVEMTPAEITLDLSDADAESEIPIGAYVEETKPHADYAR